jgi:hypothetical protein
MNTKEFTSKVIEKYADLLSGRNKRKPSQIAQLLNEFFQARLDEIESQADELLAEKKETVH